MEKQDPGSSIKAVLFGIALAVFSICPANGKQTKYETLHNDHEIVAKHECGQNDYYAITKDNYGGYSYGKWQISTERRHGRTSTFDFFLIYLKEHSPKTHLTLEVAGGQPAAYKGTKEFIAVWNTLVNKKEFRELYDAFLLHQQIIPVYQRLDAKNNEKYSRVTQWGLEDNAVQAAIKSTIIQHGMGGAYKMFTYVMDTTNPKTKEAFLKDLYNHRKKRFPKYAPRYTAEHSDLNTFLRSGQSTIVVANNIFERMKSKIFES